MVGEIEMRDQDLRSMHAALAASEQHHRAMAENVNDLITRVTPDGTSVYVSPACKRLLGYEPEELIGTGPTLPQIDTKMRFQERPNSTPCSGDGGGNASPVRNSGKDRLYHPRPAIFGSSRRLLSQVGDLFEKLFLLFLTNFSVVGDGLRKAGQSMADLSVSRGLKVSYGNVDGLNGAGIHLADNAVVDLYIVQDRGRLWKVWNLHLRREIP